MKLFKLLLRASRGMILFTLVMGLISGACNAALIALINVTLHQSGSSKKKLAVIFAAIIVTKIITSALSQVALTRFSQKAVADLRRRLVHRVLLVSLRQLEEIGVSRILANLIDDVLTITAAMTAIPNLAVSFAIVLGGAIYLAWLSPVAFAMIVFFVLLAIGIYRLFVTQAYRYVKLAREQQDALFSHLRALTEGIKELKLHRKRREAFLMERIQTTTERLQDYSILSTKRFIVGHSWAQAFLFGAIAWILFGLPELKHSSPQALTGYLLTFVYLMGPLGNILNSINGFSRADVAVQKVEGLGISLQSLVSEEIPASAAVEEPQWQRLELTGVTHSYHREKDDSHFMLGPIDLAFRPGELVFIVGGNGSGKSTLAKVLTGLYPPETGSIHLDGKRIDDRNRDAYRQIFSAVFSDFYLFDTLLGMEAANLDSRARCYLEQLHLDHKVKITNGVLSTTELSQGQRKRMALLTAYMEDRLFYVFDEWASDQDPQFKEIFYTQLLPDLKAKGKAILVITHDDKYVGVADRCLKMEDGKLSQIPLKDTCALARPVP